MARSSKRRLRIAGAEARRACAAGESFSFGPTHIPRLTCQRGRTISIHAYAPPLWRLEQYTVDECAALLRLSVSYADELPPIAITDLPAVA